MKKTILTLAFITALLSSCNETQHKNEKSETVETSEGIHEHQMEEMVAENHSMNNDWISEIKLDNDTKWQANRETTEGVLNLVKSSTPKNVEGYHNLASQLNTEKNLVITECTMKGPSHDNLHIFLHPLIEKIEALGKVSTTDEGALATSSIKENLEAYHTYFQ